MKTKSTLTRRAFLKHSACAAGAVFAAPLILSSRARGADGQTAPSKRITIGFIGTGRQCYYNNIPQFLNEEDAQVVAVCDVDQWRLDQAKAKVEAFYKDKAPSGSYKGCASYRDFRELLAREDIDAVMISTPDHWHVPIALAAARAGKDISCEKPLTRNIAEGRRLADLVAQKKLVFRTDSEFRCLRRFHSVAQVVRNGKLGQLQRIITGTGRDPTLAAQPEMPVPPGLDYDMWLGPAPEAPYTVQRVHPQNNLDDRPGWLCITDYADGMLANWGAHLNDIAMWANNTERTGPIEIEGTGSYPPAGNLWNVIQDFSVDFTFANGVKLTCRSLDRSKDDDAFIRFEGTEGWYHVPFAKHPSASAPELLKWKPGPDDLTLTHKISEKRDFLDCVKTRERTMIDAEGGHRVTALSHLGLAAVTLGRKLKWDPVKEDVVGNDDEARRLLAPKPVRAKWEELTL